VKIILTGIVCPAKTAMLSLLTPLTSTVGTNALADAISEIASAKIATSETNEILLFTMVFLVFAV
jgi:hypothetical protein